MELETWPSGCLQAASRILFYETLSHQLQSYGFNLKNFGTKGREKFTREAKAQKVEQGFVSSNRDFYFEILRPIILENRQELLSLPLTERINALRLFIFLAFDSYIGSPVWLGHFYRWGGDIFDIDNPQANDIRTSYAYGIDCSGYVASAFDILVYEKLQNPRDPLFNFLTYRERCLDRMPFGKPSKHRLNVSDFIDMGQELFNEQSYLGSKIFSVLSPTDFIVIPKAPQVFPHVVSVVKIKESFFIAESANSGSLTLDYIAQKGSFLPLTMGLEILLKRKVKFSYRKII